MGRKGKKLKLYRLKEKRAETRSGKMFATMRGR
jgi:hypothetical protein